METTRSDMSPGVAEQLRSRIQRAEIDARAKGPVLHFFLSGVFWLLVGSTLALLASFKLHWPRLLMDVEWLNFGRVRPAHLNTMVYGWASMASVAVSLWMMSRLCRVQLRGVPWLHLSAGLFNIGNVVGTVALLRGYSTSFEWLEYPKEAGLFLIAGYVPLMVAHADMAWRRKPGHIYVSQWWIMAATFWFPMLYDTAQVLMLWNPVAAPAQAPVNWWYAHNSLGLWFTPIGLASAYYLIPKVTGKPIHSYYLSIIGFWSLAFFYAWNGMHHLIGGPYPAWLISASVVASVMMVIPVIATAINHHFTMIGRFGMLRTSPTLRFVVFAGMSYTVVSFQGSLTAVRAVSRVTHFTHYTVAHAHLGMYAFVTMMLFGAAYYMIPRLTGREWPSVWLIRIHFWASALGMLHYWFMLTYGGTRQGFWLLDESIPFIDIVQKMRFFLEHRSWAGVSMVTGHLAFTLSLIGLFLAKPTERSTATLFPVRSKTRNSPA